MEISITKKIIFTLIFLLLVVIILESGFKIWDIISGNIVSEDVKSLVYINKTEIHPYLKYTSRKNYNGLLPFLEPGKRFSVQTNSHGFRTHEFYPKLPGHFRIVIIGDSFMFGWNANQEETVAVRLEKLLQEHVSDKIEVLSLGIPSYSCVRYSMLTKIYLDYLDPDMLIVAVDQSDFEEDLNRIGDYILDEKGVPVILKEGEKIMQEGEK